MVDDPVVLALQTAIAAADSAELRAALADHYRRKGKPVDALRELEAALRFAPGDGRILTAAADQAEAAGDAGKAQAFRLAAQHLGGRAGPAPRQARPVSPLMAPGAPTPPEPVQGGLRLAASDGVVLDETEDAHGLTLADVGGLDAVKDRLEKSFLLPLKRPDLFERFGKKITGGLLLYGPPGCGKTFIARALAGELGARFMSIGLSDVLDMWLGESERKLHQLFENARRMAPTLLFFDEVDALGQRRTQLKHSAGRNIVNQLLSELDGVGSKNDNVFVLGATNHPWDVDPAMRRPGRFDRTVFVPPPDAAARLAILTLKLRNRPCASDQNFSEVVRATDGFSGADLGAVVDAATEIAIELTLAEGRDHDIDAAMLAAAAREVRPSVRPWLETARNFAIYANEGGVYDDLMPHLSAAGLG